ncbi:hypothetical protein J1G44_06720 [Cellulomonas sp. zg-ZUI199]|uniref:Cardiolipin synthase N-terminal domain-containing protein n=1 Tax=Cellulomonas wangleii TaxID=2816956 RepID=A0ABX8D562_9CELL|nr:MULTISPECIES: hypothetical protein [Cellulomonas]MBO0898820.1 hypothetical protein [Cellulomonas sp. zg-ZUI22]MBO0923891.1 hypothetical protein [Cellulomonas wangleii]MBO0924173.1 hypothetical protein [Cellulomonas wangleii]QVI62193.1 hypothetical protein KG103_17565 [Cellulomonas wangleii]
MDMVLTGVPTAIDTSDVTETATETATEWTDWLAGGVGLAVLIAVYVVMLVAYVRIIQKAGYSGWWVLVGLVPVLNVVMFLVFAFSRWPVLRENERLRSLARYEP